MAIEHIGIRNPGPRVSTGGKSRTAPAPHDDAAPPKSRAILDFIPSPESLATLINSAVASLRKGVYWDRGSILNLLA